MSLTYNDASCMLHDAVGRIGRNGAAPADLLDTVSAIAEPCVLAGLVHSLCQDPAIVADCAARSFRHPLGFDKLTLVDALPLFMLRIHVWWPDISAGVDHVHNHRFGFVSSVIRGGYDMQVYQQDGTGIPMTEYAEEVSPELGWQLRCMGDARLRPLGTVRLQQGASYALPPEALHRVTVVRSAPCVTLFLQNAASRSTTQVFVPPEASTPARIPKEVLDSDAYRRELDLILAELASPAGVPARP